jgi:predicted enzyme related to lactoylglutathione lyase
MSSHYAMCDNYLMEQRISLITLGVKNLSSARAFYEQLGWGGAEQPDDEICFFQAGGMVFGLWTALGGHGAPGIELAYNVRSVEEVQVILSEAQRAGGTIVRPAAVAEWGGITGAFADPEGYVWEVAHNPSWILHDDGTVHL